MQVSKIEKRIDTSKVAGKARSMANIVDEDGGYLAGEHYNCLLLFFYHYCTTTNLYIESEIYN